MRSISLVIIALCVAACGDNKPYETRNAIVVPLTPTEHCLTLEPKPPFDASKAFIDAIEKCHGKVNTNKGEEI